MLAHIRKKASERSVLASRACINTSALTEVIAREFERFRRGEVCWCFMYRGFALCFFLIFLVFTGRPWLKSVVDPCAHLDRTNPDYSIFPDLLPAPTGMLGLAWLWNAIWMDMPLLRAHMTLDEYMVLRWFRMCAIFFLFASVFCTPVLVYFISWTTTKT